LSINEGGLADDKRGEDISSEIIEVWVSFVDLSAADIGTELGMVVMVFVLIQADEDGLST